MDQCIRQCVCKSHYIEAMRHHGNIDYVPKWKGVTVTKDIHTCSYPGCHATKVIKPLFEQEEAIMQYINAQGTSELLLCNMHYQSAYKHFNNTCTPCAGCGALPKRRASYTRHCPNPDVINEHMQLHMDYALNLTASDTICFTCYKIYNQILNDSEKEEVSYDSALNELISNLKTTPIKGDTLLVALNSTAIYVANHLLMQQALLLPHVSALFLQLYGTASDQSPNVETGESTIKYSSRWLLTQLILYLGIHMEYKCVHKKFGVVLYRRNGDLLKSLSWALGTSPNFNTPNLQLNSATYSSVHKLHEASEIVNEMLHKEIKRANAEKHEIECSSRYAEFYSNWQKSICSLHNSSNIASAQHCVGTTEKEQAVDNGSD